MRYIFLALLLIPYTELLTAGSDSITTGSYKTEAILTEGSELTFCAEAEFCSSYIFRGIVLRDNFVMQPGITAYYKNFNAGVWSNFDSPGRTMPAELSEVDLFASHELNLHNFTIRNLAAIYFFSGIDNYPTTAEYTLGAAYTTRKVTFCTDITVDFMEYPGSFIAIHGITYENRISSKLYFNSSISISWAGSKYNEVNTGLNKAAFDHLGIDLALTYYPAENFYMKSHFVFNRVIDAELHQYIGKQNSFFGILTGFTF